MESNAITKLLLTPKEAAMALSISERSLWSAMARGELRAVRIGRSVRYDTADLRDFIDRKKGGRP